MPPSAESRPYPVTHRFALPGGWVDDAGQLHVEAQLLPVTGSLEQHLAELASTASVAALSTFLLGGVLQRMGDGQIGGADLARALLVQDRDYLLARVYSLTFGRELWVQFSCGECREPMELRLLLDELGVEPRPLAARYFALDGEIEFRLPTGADQEWAATRLDEGRSVVPELIARCVRGRGTAGPAQLEGERAVAIEQRMRELAPDVAVEVEACCPHCRGAFSQALDLPLLTLERLARSGQQVDQDVDMLAWHYHWSEQEILALPSTRRRRYTRLIQDRVEGGWS